jgi:Phage integrase, N-terminal SAM-like domain
MVKTGKTFTDAADEWLAYCENVRDCKPSTMRDYRNMVRVLDREFGKRKIETITTEDIDLWISGYGGSNRTRQKYLVCLGSIFKRAMKAMAYPATRPISLSVLESAARRRSTCCGRRRFWRSSGQRSPSRMQRSSIPRPSPDSEWGSC